MFIHEEKVSFIEVPEFSISALYASANQAPVILSGRAPAPASAVIVGYRLDEGRFGVVAAMHLSGLNQNLVFSHDDDGLDAAGARSTAEEALRLFMSMGFQLNPVPWSTLVGPERQKKMAELRVFSRPPEGAPPRMISASAPAVSGKVLAAVSQSRQTAGAPKSKSRRKSVLILEDDVELRQMLRTTLVPYGLDVVEAGLSREAIKAFASRSFDLMVVDGALPDGPGTAFIEEVRRVNQMIPIVFMSTLSTFFRDPPMHRRLKMELQVRATFHKPIEPQAFAQTVLSLIFERD